MKKKNIFFSLLTMIMAAVLSVGFVSCSDDDDKKSNSEGGITGSSWVTDDGHLIINFNKNNTGTIVEKSYYSDSKTTSTFTYTMTSKTEGMMVVKEYDYSNGSGYSNEIYYFEIRGQILYIYFESGVLYYTCTQNNSNIGETDSNIGASSIGGTSWTYQEGRESITINFKSDGTGTFVEKYYDSYSGMETDTYSFTYTMTGKTEGRMIIKYYDSYSGYDNEVFYFEIEGKTLYLYNDYGDSLVFSRK